MWKSMMNTTELAEISGVPGGGGWWIQTPPEIPKALQNHAKPT